MKKLIAMLLVLMTLTATASAEELGVYFAGASRGAEESFAQSHPGVTVKYANGDDYLNTTEKIVAALLTQSFPWDVFGESTGFFAPSQLIDKGYWLDLSGSEVIREAVGRMHPALQEQVIRDGAIYAIPTAVYTQPSPILVNMDAWEELGFTESDIPDTFGALLDFLDDWVSWQRDDPDARWCVKGNWDEALYDEHSYARWLVELLAENHVLQQQAAGEPIRFDDPLLIDLMEHARRTGDALYAIEPSKRASGNGTSILVQDDLRADSWSKATERVCLRLREDQPRLMPGSVSLTGVHAGTASAPLAIAYLESLLAGMGEMDRALLFTDAQPVEDPNLPYEVQNMENLIALAEHRLNNDDTPYVDYMNLDDLEAWRMDTYANMANQFYNVQSDDEVRDQLMKWQAELEKMRESGWLFSPENLAAYQACVAEMIFPEVSVFAVNTPSGQNFRSLLHQFADGLMEARQLAVEIDRIAWMMEMENQ